MWSALPAMARPRCRATRIEWFCTGLAVTVLGITQWAVSHRDQRRLRRRVHAQRRAFTEVVVPAGTLSAAASNGDGTATQLIAAPPSPAVEPPSPAVEDEVARAAIRAQMDEVAAPPSPAVEPPSPAVEDEVARAAIRAQMDEVARGAMRRLAAGGETIAAPPPPPPDDEQPPLAIWLGGRGVSVPGCADDCHAQPYADLGGRALLAGPQNLKDSASACCEACRTHRQGAAALDDGCNVWVWCGDAGGCGASHRHCWLKRQPAPMTLPAVSALGDAWGKRVPWTSGVWLETRPCRECVTPAVFHGCISKDRCNSSRACGSPAIDGYSHVVPKCFDASPTAKVYKQLLADGTECGTTAD